MNVNIVRRLIIATIIARRRWHESWTKSARWSSRRGQLREERVQTPRRCAGRTNMRRGLRFRAKKHAEALVERLDRVLRARESSARAREEALADGERNLSKRLAELAMERARLREDADGWKFKATSCERELNEIRLRLAGEFDLDDDDGFEELRGDESLTVARLRRAGVDENRSSRSVGGLRAGRFARRFAQRRARRFHAIGVVDRFRGAHATRPKYETPSEERLNTRRRRESSEG